METKYPIAGLVAAVTISSSSLVLPYDHIEYSSYFNTLPVTNSNDISRWSDNKLINSDLYSIQDNSDYAKYKIMNSFANNLLENSKDVEPEYVDFVNEHFWELI